MPSWETWINLAALGAFIGAIGAVGWLLIRSIPRIRGEAHPVCGGCGADANQINNFLCASCKQDVRECLINIPKTGRTTSLIRHVGIVTLLIALLAAVTWQWMQYKLPWSNRWIFQHGEVPLFTVPPLRRIELRHVGQQLGPGHFDGVIHADAYLMNEELVRLEVYGPDSPRCRIIDARGKIIVSDVAFSESVVAQWILACGIIQPWIMADVRGGTPRPTTSATTKMISALQFAKDVSTEIDFMTKNAGVAQPRRSRGYTWTDNDYQKSAWFMPVTVTSWSLLWLALVAWQVRASARAAEKERGK